MDVGKAIKVFYCYAPEDRRLLDQLDDHLSGVKLQYHITTWFDEAASPGLELEKEIAIHLNSSQIILFLVSPSFMASEHNYAIVKRSLEQYDTRQKRIIPIILRPTDWQSAPFKDLTVLPASKLPVSKWPDRDEAFLDVVQGIRLVIEELLDGFKKKAEEMNSLRWQYCKTLHQQWKMLDFKGIHYNALTRPVSIPLTEVFILPNVFAGIPEDETLERGEARYIYKEKESRNTQDGRQHIPYNKYRTYTKTRAIVQHEDLHTIIAKQRRLVILGDPGSGKSTLLQYLLLILAEQNNRLSQEFPQLAVEASTISPLYISLATFAGSWLSHSIEERSLRDFIPKYLRYTNLDAYTQFIDTQLESGELFILLDGLDEIPDFSLRMQVVRHIETFTQSYPKNRFIITSRIVGYKDAPIAAEYHTYTLADFSKEQVNNFAQKWCLAYEYWVNQTQENQSLQAIAAKEAEKLFFATRRNEEVKRLAVNPLLLTILALMQRQGIELPVHRVELFEICTATLLETWLRTKTLLEIPLNDTRLNKQNLIKILRPLAFWMHQYSTIRGIPEEELLDQIIKLLFGKITRSRVEAQMLATKFLEIVRGRTGILIERGKDHYSFLHLTFEEYFAASELVIRKDRDIFIKKHLHEPRWRPVILLAVSIIGIRAIDEDTVTEIVQKNILEAQSPFERWLQRDLVFAGLCLADDIGINISLEDSIISRTIHRYLTTPYESLRTAFAGILNAWKGTHIAIRAIELLLKIKYKQEQVPNASILLPQSPLLFSYTSQLEEDFSAFYHQIFKKNAESSTRLMSLHIIMILYSAGLNMGNRMQYALSSLEDGDWTVRQTAAKTLGLLGQGYPEIISALLHNLADGDWAVRQAAIEALGRIGNDDPHVIDALLHALTDTEPDVQQAAARVLGLLEKGHSEVVPALLQILPVSERAVQQAILEALGRIGGEDPRIIKLLLKTLTETEPAMQQAAAKALGLLECEQPEVISALLQSTNHDDWAVQQAALEALDCIINAHPPIIDSLLQFLTNTEPAMQQAAARALGLSGSEHPQIVPALLQCLTHAECIVQQAALEALGQIGNAELPVIDALLQALMEAESSIQQTAAKALGLLGSEQPEVISALLKSVTHDDWSVQQAAVEALGRLGNAEPQVIDALLLALAETPSDVQQAAARALGLLGGSLPQVVPALLQSFGEGDWVLRQTAVEALGHLGNAEPPVIAVLLQALTDTEPAVQQAGTRALALLGKGQSEIVDALLKTLTGVDPAMQQAGVRALGQMGKGQPEILHTLLRILIDSSLSMQQNAVEALTHLCNEDSEILTYLLAILSDIHSYDFLYQHKVIEQEQEILRTITIRKISLLGQLGNGRPEAIDALLTELVGAESNIKQAVLEALGQENSEKAELLEALFQMLSAIEPDVRQAAARALGQIGTRRPEVIDALLKGFADNSSYVRQAAITALGQVGTSEPEIIDALLKGFADNSSYVRQAAAKALKQINTSQPGVTAALLARLVQTTPNRRPMVIEALGQIGNGQPEVIEALLQMLADDNWMVWQAAVGALEHSGYGHLKVIEALLQMLKKTDSGMRRAAAAALSQVGYGQLAVIEALLQVLTDPEWNVRQTAAEALGQLGNGHLEVIEKLLERLSDRSSSVRQAVITALGQLGQGHPEVTHALLQKLGESGPDIQQAAAEALGQLGNRQYKVIETLLEKLSDPSSFVRQAVITALGQLGQGQPKITHALLCMLTDDEWIVRQSTVKALGQLGDGQPEIIETLLEKLCDPSSSVRLAVIKALAMLPIDALAVGRLIEDMLLKHEAAFHIQLVADDIADTLLDALKQVNGYS